MERRKPIRKVTEVPQPSDLMEHVVDEDVHKELGNRLATPNESSSQGTNSGGGPRCQEAMRDTTAQTRRVKKLEMSNMSRKHKLKRLYTVGLTAKVESFGDEDNLGENASKQGRRIDDIDQYEYLTLVNDQDYVVMFDLNDLGDVAITTEEITLAQALEALKTSKPKVKGTFIQEQEEPKEPIKPKKKEQIRLDEETALRLQAEFDEEERLARERAQKEQEANIALIKTWDDAQAKIDVDYQLVEILQAQDQEYLPDV
nr:hypothetical protein [Tanacetum cinerariifolium]